MTSVAHQSATPSQSSSSAIQPVAQVQSSAPTSGTSSPQAAIPGRTHANATKKATSAHGKSDSISPAVPTLTGPTIANGNNAINSAPYHVDHNRKTSVTISAAGTSGQMPNGGPVAGKPATGNGIQFGSMNANSPNVAHSTPTSTPAIALGAPAPSNQHVTSPSPSPSPIPQPPASGGRPPSSLHGQGAGLSFGSIGDENGRRPSMPGSLTPGMQAAHLRRDSSQSSHADMNNGMGPNGARGGYQQGGRGRGGYSHQPYSQPPYAPSPSASFRPIPNAPRGNQNMPSPYMSNARPLASGFPNSPHQAAHSPSLAASQPAHHQQAQMAMPNAQMHQPYYNPQMHHQQGQFMHQGFDPNAYPYYSGYMQPGMQPGLQPGMQPMQPGIQPGMQSNMPVQYGVPPSPRPQYAPPGHQQQYVPGQYNQPQQMSRTPSGVSERPSSSMGPSQAPIPSAGSHHASASRTSNSPAPSSTFVKPPRKSAILIKDPNTGETKDFKNSASPAPSKSPANSAVAPTPPPTSKTPSHVDSQHNRTESQAGKTNTEKAEAMQAAVRQKLKDDMEAERLAKEQAENAKQNGSKEVTETEKHPIEPSLSDEKKSGAAASEDVKITEPDAVSAEVQHKVEEAKSEQAKSEEAKLEKSISEESKAEVTEAEKDEKKVAEEADVGTKIEPEPVKEEETKKLAPEDDPECDEYWAKIEAEEEAKEKEREAAYQKKKAAQDEIKKQKEAEEAARLDEEMKKAEREAEAAEEARIKKLEEQGEGEKEQESSKLFAELKKSDNAFQATKISSAADTPGESGAVTPVSDASSMGPPARAAGSKQKPAALKLETTKQVEPPQPSAALQSLRSAKFLTSVGKSIYPAAIQSPNPALNSAAPMGKFRYDKDFLLQFQKVFVEKPSETWSERLKETVGDTSDTPQSARPPRTGGSMGARNLSQRGPAASGGGFGGAGTFGAFTSKGRTLPANTTSQQRYEASLQGSKGATPMRYNPGQGGFPVGFGPPSMSRTGSSTGGTPHSPRTNPSRRGGGSKGGKRENEKDAKNMPLTAGMDLKPIQVSESGWKPTSIGKGSSASGPLPGGENYLAPDIVQKKVKSALNKMTPTNFDKLAGQILDIVAQSQKETDGRTLRQVIGLTFEKATDEAHWAAMYAEWCGRMLAAVQTMVPEIRDETLPLDKNGKVNAGGTLFRKYLLNRCQQDFEAGWKAKLPDKPEGESAEAVMLSDEYYAAAAAKRRGLGLVRFIGELYKLGMLTSRIMHMCVKRLVDFEGIPDEAEVESLTSLLKTIGGNLDSEEKARPSMDAYFGRINDMMNVEGLPSRLKFMLLDIVDLRKHGWKGKEQGKGPATIEEVRAQAAEAERLKEVQRVADQSRRGGGRMPMGRGDARNFSGGNNFMPPPTNTVGMDDLRRLGRGGGSRQASSQGTSFGPPSMFNTRGSNTRKSMGPGILGRGGEDSGASSRTATPPALREKKEKEEKEAAKHANAFSALAALDSSEANDHPGSPPSSNTSPALAKARPAIERQRSKSPLKDEEKSNA